MELSLGRLGTFAAVLVVGVATTIAACSSSGETNALTSGAGTESGAGGQGVGGSIFSGAGGNGGSGGLEECAGDEHVGNLTPVDVVIMLDQSGSMASPVGGSTIWELVTGAIDTFVAAPESDGLGVGLQYFPLPDGPCNSCTGCNTPNLQLTDTGTGTCCCSYPTGQGCSLPNGTACPSGGVCFGGTCYSGGNNGTCSAADYAALEVPIALLPGNGGDITTSLGNHGPRGLTPTGPALQGAIDAAAAHAAANPEHAVAVVLATDGVPTECDPQAIDQIAALAAAAANATPPVRTFVIGIGNVAGMNEIALAGGTDGAFVINVGNAGDEFLDALNEIRGSLLACDFAMPVPDMGEADPNLVNVELTPDGGTPTTIPRVPSAADCTAAGGWYYDDPANPSRIILCPASCDEVKSLNMATIKIVLGCKTIVF